VKWKRDILIPICYAILDFADWYFLLLVAKLTPKKEFEEKKKCLKNVKIFIYHSTADSNQFEWGSEKNYLVQAHFTRHFSFLIHFALTLNHDRPINNRSIVDICVYTIYAKLVWFLAKSGAQQRRFPIYFYTAPPWWLWLLLPISISL
jgi:hypothetical protein